MKHISYIFLGLVLVCMASCTGQRHIVYFQDMPSGARDTIQDTLLIRLQVSDKVNIHVSARDPEISNLFSLYTSGTATGSSTQKSGYTIDSEGNINFPILGKLHVAGMTREELRVYPNAIGRAAVGERTGSDCRI